MKKLLSAFIALLSGLTATAQINWQTYSNLQGFWDMDTLNGKLYVSTGIVNEFDGTTWTPLNNYNNSLNTPHKTKSCVRSLDGKLYAGAKDFNTSGEGNIHYFDGANWTLFQNADLPYHGNNKIRSFAKYNGDVYMSGIFSLQNSAHGNIARWDGTEWVGVGRHFGTQFSNPEITDMVVYQNKLYITNGNNVWNYNGTTWDSLFVEPNSTPVFPMASSITDLVVYNNELYIAGNFALSMTEIGMVLVKYNGSSISAVARAMPGHEPAASAVQLSGIYSAVRRLGVADNRLFFTATKASDQRTYLVNYNGSTVSELGAIGSTAGSDIYAYNKIFPYGGNLLIGGNFSEIGGQPASGIAYVPLSSLVSVPEMQSQSPEVIHIYPNPASKFLTIEGLQHYQPLHIHILNLHGKIVAGEQLSEGKHTVDVSQLPSGMYIVGIKTASGIINKRVVIE